MKIISGGQTGVDRIGLQVARSMGIETGGTAAKGWWTELGPDPSLAEFGLVEAKKFGYPFRTIKNVMDSDGTVLFGDISSSGSQLTIDACIMHKKRYLSNPQSEELADWIRRNEISVLNIAGNRGSILPEEKVLEIIKTLQKALFILGYKKAEMSENQGNIEFI